jgi:hypothetical protein
MKAHGENWPKPPRVNFSENKMDVRSVSRSSPFHPREKAFDGNSTGDWISHWEGLAVAAEK